MKLSAMVASALFTLTVTGVLSGCGVETNGEEVAESDDALQYTWTTANGVIGEIANLTNNSGCTVSYPGGQIYCKPIPFADKSASIGIASRYSQFDGLVTWDAAADTTIIQDSVPSGLNVSLNRKHSFFFGTIPLPPSTVLEASGIATPTPGAYWKTARINATVTKVTLTGTIAKVMKVDYNSSTWQCFEPQLVPVTASRASEVQATPSWGGGGKWAPMPTSANFTTKAPLRGVEVLDELEQRVKRVPGFKYPVLAEDYEWVRQNCGVRYYYDGPIR